MHPKLMTTITLHNVPSQPTPFIGREPEITEIVELLRDEQCRLLTLLGAGGMGKTRLSIEVVKQLSDDDFEHGVYYIRLAPLTSPDQIVTAIISTLGMMIGNDDDIKTELIKYLGRRNLLLVMDNFEHVIDGADLVADILVQAPHVKVLTTSREPLNLLEEHLWHLHGLQIPESVTTNHIDQFSGLQLFIERAQRVQRNFDIQENLEQAIKICQMVGGMPLAIELSASWLKSLTCAEIIDEIQRNIDFLQTNARNIPERHRSIRAVFQNSWDLCDDKERTTFRRLCIFRGGFRREDAEALTGTTLLTLTGLVEKSMLQKFEDGRYKLHRLSRQFADEQLALVGETDQLHTAHMEHFAEFMKERAVDIKGRRQIDGLNEIEAEFYNVRKAWYHAVDTRRLDALDHMMEGLTLYCDIRAQYQTGEDLFRHVLDHLPTPANRTYNRIQARFIQIWNLLERYPITDHLQSLAEKTLDVAETYDDRLTVMLCYWYQAEFERFGYRHQDHQRALHRYEQALKIAQQVGDKYYIGRILRGIDFLLSSIKVDQSDKARSYSHQAESIVREIGDQNGLAHILYYKSAIDMMNGNDNDAEKHIQNALAIWETCKDIKSIGIVYSNLGALYLQQSKLKEAETHLRKSDEILTQVNFLGNHPMIYGNMSVLASLQGKNDEAYRFAQVCKSYPWSLPWYHRAMAFYDANTSNYESIAAHVLTIWQLDFYPQFTEIITSVFVAYDRQDYTYAVELISFVWNHPAIITGWLGVWRRFSELSDTLLTQLGDPAYQIAWEKGKQQNPKDTLTELTTYLAVDRSAKVTTSPLVDPLTERELEVLALIAEGLTNPQIGEKLYLSTGTVKVHTRNIYGKLAVKNRTEAATKARELKLI